VLGLPFNPVDCRDCPSIPSTVDFSISNTSALLSFGSTTGIDTLGQPLVTTTKTTRRRRQG